MAFRKRAKSGRIAGTINITPLIDILLVLLVIFMTASSTTSKTLPVEIPQPSERPRVDKPEPPIIVSVDGQGSVQINHATSEGTLQPRLREILSARRDRTIFLHAATTLPFETVAHVIDESRAAGAIRIGLMTEPTN